MKENVLDVLMYLFENYYMEDEGEREPDRESIRADLLEVGFAQGEIRKAFDWLDGLARQRDHSPGPVPNADHAIRLYSDTEMERLDEECRGFLMYLEQTGVLSPMARELVIDRIMALDTGEIDIDELKWVTLMVMFNQPGQEAAYAWIEDLVFDSPVEYVH